MKERALPAVVASESEKSVLPFDFAQVTGLKKHPGFWLWLGVLGFVSFPWCPMALRWPVRAGIFIAFLWAGRLAIRQIQALPREHRRKDLYRNLRQFLLTGLAMVILTPALKVAIAQGKLSSTESVQRVEHLRSELNRRGIDLVVMAQPEYSDLFPEDRDSDRNPGWMERLYATRALEQLSESGIPTFDLFSLFESHVSQKTDWKSDQVHLLPESTQTTAEALAAQLRTAGIGPGDEGERKIILMGNCFAGQFANAMRKTYPEWSKARGLTALGDHGRVPDLLFLFPDEYLKDTDLVIWMMHYKLLASDSLPHLTANPLITDGTIRTATIRVQSTLGWSKAEARKRLSGLPYPDALVEMTGEVLKSDDFDFGEEILVAGPGVRGRKALPLSRIKPGYQITLNLIPFDAHVARHPKIASAYTLNTSERFGLERFWIHSWTLVR